MNDRSVIRVGAIGSTPYLFDCADQISCPERGLAADMVLFVCDLLSIRCVFRFRSDTDYGMLLPNGTWTGAIGDILAGDVDTYIPVFTPTWERSEVLQFSNALLDDNVMLMTRMPVSDDVVSLNVVRVFSMQVWSLFAVSMSVIWLLRCFSERFNNREHASPTNADRTDRIGLRLGNGAEIDRRYLPNSNRIRAYDKGVKLGHCCCRSNRRRNLNITDVTRGGVDRNRRVSKKDSFSNNADGDPKVTAVVDTQVREDVPLTYVDRLTASQRWTYGMEWFICLIALTTISGVTVSHRLVATDRLPFNDVDSFSLCLEKGECRLAANSATTNYLMTITGNENALSERMTRALRRYPLVLLPNEDVIKQVTERKDVFMTVIMSGRRANYLRRLYQNDQQLHLVDTPLLNTGTFPVALNNTNFLRALNKAALVFKELGFAQHFNRKYGSGPTKVSEAMLQRKFMKPKPVQLPLLMDIFLIITVGWCISIVVFTLERWCNNSLLRKILSNLHS